MSKQPKLFMLIGLPGSGKSTFARNKVKFYDNTCNETKLVIVSSDDIREELYGTRSCQKDPARVFEIAHERIINSLEQGWDVIFDATNITRKNRASLLKKIPAYTEKFAQICWAPISTCIERDLKREFSVKADVIWKMAYKFQMPFYDEGFDHICISYPEDFNYKTYIEEDILNPSNINMSHDSPYHSFSIWEHCKKAEEYAINNKFSSFVVNAAKYHDIGKFFTKSFINSKGEVTDRAHFYKHENVGAWLTLGVFNNSTVDNESIIFTAWLVSQHMSIYALRQSGRNKYLDHLPHTWYHDLYNLFECDQAAH